MSNSQWQVIFHLSGFSGLSGPGVLNWAVPLALWLIKRENNPDLDRAGKEVLNFQISVTLYSLVLGAAAALLAFILVGFLLVPALFVLWVAWMVLMVVAAFKASNGEFYTYPATIRFIQ